MAREKDIPADLPEEPGGTLADAISAHLNLKREHGADPAEIEQEQREALAPPRRDTESPAAPQAAPPPPEPPAAPPQEPVAESVPEPVAEPESEPEPAIQPDPVSESASAVEPEPAPQPEPAPGLESEPAPAPAPALKPTPAYREDTGTIEFEWSGDSDRPPAEAPQPTTPTGNPDVLEQIPEFFEETPEYDKLWFEERPPREFDF